MEITRDRVNRYIYISQRQYTYKIIEKYGYKDLNAAATPWPSNLELPTIWKPIGDKQLSYIKQTGSLNYLSVNTRPDITLTTNRLSEANQGPSEQHLQLLKHLFRYLIGSYNLSLRYGRKFPISNLQLRAYGDASFADRIDTRFSTAGHIVFLAGSPILWKSKKQTLVTLSSTEAEFVNLTPTASSLLWVHQILKDAGYPQPMCQIELYNHVSA